MVTQSDFPDKWSCTSPQKQAKVEVRTPNGEEVSDQATRSQDPNPDTIEFGVGNIGPNISKLRIAIVDETQDNEEVLSFQLDDMVFSDGRFRIEIERRRLPDNPGLRVTDAVQYEWIEIPTNSVELWEEKGNASAIQRTAKVKFPTEWGQTPPNGAHNSPRQLIDEFEEDSEDGFMFGRVQMKDATGQWVIKHLGWLGGVGNSSDVGLSKLWIYDFAEFLDGVPVGETFRDPTIEQAVEKIATLTWEETPAPIVDVELVPPQTEEEFQIIAEQINEDLDFTDKLAISEQTTNYAITEAINGPDRDVRVFAGVPERENAGIGASYYFRADRAEETVQFAEGQYNITVDLQNFNSIRIGEPSGQLFQRIDPKSFVANHDTLKDVWEWFEEKTFAKLHFEPQLNGGGVVLVADIVPERRNFAQEEVILNELGDLNLDYAFHQPITVMENDALYEMKPDNTVHLRGATAGGFLQGATGALDLATFGIFSGSSTPKLTYPVVKAQVPALVEAANGTEVSGAVIESDAKKLETAKLEAKRALTQRLEEQTEGSILMRGAPRLLPFDKVTAYETCGERFQYEQTPAEYEVESVKHIAEANEAFKTEATVSIFVNDRQIEFKRAEMVEVQG